MKTQIENVFGRVDILFNNAGVMLPSMEIERMTVADWQKTFNININGMFYVTRALKPFLLKTQGTIINNASIAGLQYYAAGRSYAYSASKAAVIQFSHQMAKIRLPIWSLSTRYRPSRRKTSTRRRAASYKCASVRLLF